MAVDIFSMGCVFYYVLCKEHPYGENYERQLRISTGKFDLSKLKGSKSIFNFEIIESSFSS